MIQRVLRIVGFVLSVKEKKMGLDDISIVDTKTGISIIEKGVCVGFIHYKNKPNRYNISTSLIIGQYKSKTIETGFKEGEDEEEKIANLLIKLVEVKENVGF